MLLNEAMAQVDTPEGRARVKAYLESLPFPHFEACPDNPKLLVRIDEDGTRTVGKFVQREFVSCDPNAPEVSGLVDTE